MNRLREFEEWARSKEFNMETERNTWPLFKDPITKAAYEGYLQGHRAAESFWKSLYMHAAFVIWKHNLNQEFQDTGPTIEKAIDQQVREMRGVKPKP